MSDFGWSYPAGCNGTPFDEDNLDFIADVEKRMLELNEGRELNCWPLGSFGGKDADLDGGGCTGIKEWGECTEEILYLKVGGHKRISPPDSENEDIQDLAQEIILGSSFGGEWEGDCWCMNTSATIKVPVFLDKHTGEVNVDRVARTIIKTARDAVEPFSLEMEQLDIAMARLDDKEPNENGE